MGVGEATQSALKDTRVFASRPWHMYLKARGRTDRSMMNNVMKRTYVDMFSKVPRFAVGPSCAGFPTDLYPINKLNGNVEDPAAEKRVLLEFPAVPETCCDCMLELHVGASRWAQIGLKSASPVFVTC